MLKILTVGAVLLAVLTYYLLQQFKPKVKTPNELNPQYDYIIVGGGTAGCVLASRLSENDQTSVLLLEAGGEETELFYSHMPGAAPFLQLSDFDWQYFTVPQSDCCEGLIDRQIRTPRGKVLGGSSVINFMHYVRGHPSDFEKWNDKVQPQKEDLKNVIPDWSYSDILPYFKKLEAVQEQKWKNAGLRGLNGPISIVEGSLSTLLGRAFIEAVQFLGYPIIEDYNGATQEGFAPPQFVIENGRRVSASSAYLRPAMGRSNLHVVTRARVRRITFNYNDFEKRAAGVEYEHNGLKHRVLTNKEVILTAGAIETPHILMHSGIGPKDHLEKFGVQLIEDLPHVGQNLKDHLAIFRRYSTNESIGLDTGHLTSFFGLAKSTIQYYLAGAGPLATFPNELIGFLKSNILERDAPDLQFFFLPWDILDSEFAKLANFNADTLKAVSSMQEGRYPFAVGTSLLMPFSSGEIKLQSADPNDPPLIDPKYLSEDVDAEILMAGMKIIDRILENSPSMKRYDVRPMEMPLAACPEHEQWTPAYIHCLIKSRLQTMYHPAGTCRMGRNSNDSVVDAHLKVHGIKGLRIADASIFPDQISGNINAAVLMVAEKAADLIKNSARLIS